MRLPWNVVLGVFAVVCESSKQVDLVADHGEAVTQARTRRVSDSRRLRLQPLPLPTARLKITAIERCSVPGNCCDFPIIWTGSKGKECEGQNLRLRSRLSSEETNSRIVFERAHISVQNCIIWSKSSMSNSMSGELLACLKQVQALNLIAV